MSYYLNTPELDNLLRVTPSDRDYCAMQAAYDAWAHAQDGYRVAAWDAALTKERPAWSQEKISAAWTATFGAGGLIDCWGWGA